MGHIPSTNPLLPSKHPSPTPPPRSCLVHQFTVKQRVRIVGFDFVSHDNLQFFKKKFDFICVFEFLLSRW